MQVEKYFTARTIEGKPITLYYRGLKAKTKSCDAFNLDIVEDKSENIASDEFIEILRKVENRFSKININSSKTICHPKYSETHDLTLNKNVKESLWVEKYHPRRFTDLVSVDDSCVRFLQWATQWKSFICEKKSTENFQNFEAYNYEKIGSVILLSGGPGVGKTTLVQVVARTAGFNLIEINASDERSGDHLWSKIETSISSNSIQDLGKPNMILLDEIDGASEAGLILKLVSLIVFSRNFHSNASQTSPISEDNLISSSSPILSESSDSLNLSTNNSDSSAKNRGQSGKKRKKNLLIRPIVCICNDLYAPALRELRRVCTLLTMPPIPTPILSRRLFEIWERERKNSQLPPLDRSFFGEVAECMGGDLRGSIHSLHFLSKSMAITKTNEKETLAKLISFKDTTISPYQILKTVFNSNNNVNIRKTLDSMDSGDCERLILGIFEIFPKARFHDDTSLSKVCYLLETFSLIFGSLNNRVNPDYTTRLFWGTSRRVLASPYAFNFQYPRQDSEIVLATSGCRSIFETFRAKLSGRLGSSSSDYIITTLVPYLLDVTESLSGSFRIANPHLLKDIEKKRLERIVQILYYYGLSYKQSIADVGPEVNSATPEYEFVMDPPIERLSVKPKHMLESVEKKSKKNDNSILGMISTRLNELILINKSALLESNLAYLSKSHRASRSDDTSDQISIDLDTINLSKEPTDTIKSNSDQQKSIRSTDLLDAYKLMNINAAHMLEVKKRSTQPSTKRDFFGRPISAQNDTSLKKTLKMSADQTINSKKITLEKNAFWFRYNEGFSNAVRRTIIMKDIFNTE